MPVVPNKIAERIQYYEAHIDPWNDNSAAIGLSEEQAANFTTLVTAARADFDAAYQACEAAKNATTELAVAVQAMHTGTGGGAVGEVPFSCHFGECSPAGTHYGSSGVATATASSTNSVTLWHYGLVEWSSGVPYIVSRCSISEDCVPGTNIVTGFSASGSGTRAVAVIENGHNFTAGYHYHFEPVLSGGNAL